MHGEGGVKFIFGPRLVFSPPLQGEGWVGMGFDFRVHFSTSSSRRRPGSSSCCSFAITDPRPCAFSLADQGDPGNPKPKQSSYRVGLGPPLSPRWAKAHPIKQRRCALDPGPRVGRRRAAEKAPKGSARGIAPIPLQAMDGLSAEPGRPQRTSAQRRRRTRGALLFGYFLVGKQEKVTRSPGMASEKHRDVSRLPREAEDQNGSRLSPE